MSKLFVEFYKRNAAGQFIALNDGIEVVTSKPVIEVIRKVVSRIVQRNERGLFKRVQAYRIIKDDSALTPILTVKET
jgi:hypothetical protein